MDNFIIWSFYVEFLLDDLLKRSTTSLSILLVRSQQYLWQGGVVRKELLDSGREGERNKARVREWKRVKKYRGWGVTQEQKAENTGRQFCSCFYQLLGIGGPGSMPGRILGGSCGNVRLFSVLLSSPHHLEIKLYLFLTHLFSLLFLLCYHISSPSHPRCLFYFIFTLHWLPGVRQRGDLFILLFCFFLRFLYSLFFFVVCLLSLGYGSAGSALRGASLRGALYLRTVRAPWRKKRAVQ